MIGAVVLDELADIVGQDLVGMDPTDRLAKIEAAGLGLLDDRLDGHPLTALISEPVPDIGVVVAP
jgi:hypothetical protein